MNSEINKKTPAFIYAKEFKLSKVLGNLQAYKLATGDVGQTEQDEASRKHGNNLGALYGNLITKASLTSESAKRKQEDQHESDEGPRKRKRRKRKKQNKKKDGETQYPVPSVMPGALDEPLPLPECMKVKDDSPDSSQEDSNESSDSETVDFLGLTTGQDEESSSEESCSNITSEGCNTPNKETSSKSLCLKTANVLTTYVCSRCGRRGHLAEHCTLPQTETESRHQLSTKNTLSHHQADLQDLFSQCRRLKNANNVGCSECGNRSNLAFCFECRLTFCDGRGHLIEHLLNFPTHTKLYSHKLQKLLKCSSSSCAVVDINQLLVCPQCLSKIFDKQYSMINATWSEGGLKAIAKGVCCQEHFQWHRMNCYNSSEEFLFRRENLVKLKHERNGLLSEFFF